MNNALAVRMTRGQPNNNGYYIDVPKAEPKPAYLTIGLDVARHNDFSCFYITEMLTHREAGEVDMTGSNADLRLLGRVHHIPEVIYCPQGLPYKDVAAAAASIWCQLLVNQPRPWGSPKLVVDQTSELGDMVSRITEATPNAARDLISCTFSGTAKQSRVSSSTMTLAMLSACDAVEGMMQDSRLLFPISRRLRAS